MDKINKNKLGFFSPVKLPDVDTALSEIDFDNAFHNSECPLELEQSESTDYVKRQFGNKEVRYDG